MSRVVEKTARTMTDTVEGGTLKLTMKQWNAFSGKLYVKYFNSTQRKDSNALSRQKP